MKFYQKLTFIFLPFFFASCVSTLIKPDYVYGIRDTIEWGRLEDKILSWEGDTKSALVKSWGIPNNQMDLGNGEEQLEYFISSTDRTMTVYGSHDTTNTDAIIRFYLVNNEIKKISYNGEQHRLQEICKGYGKNWHSRSYSIYYDAEKRLKYKHPPTHEDFSTDELFTLLLPLSKYHDNKKYSRQLYQEAEDKYKKEGASKSEMELDIWRDQDTGAFFYRPLWNIESFLARVKVYREKFEGENFDWEPYFLDSINVISKPSLAIIESKTDMNLADILEQYKLFSPYSGGTYFTSTNRQIAQMIHQYKLFWVYESLDSVFEMMQNTFNFSFSPSSKAYKNFIIKNDDGRFFWIVNSNDKFWFTYFDIIVNEENDKTYHEFGEKYNSIMTTYVQNEKQIELYKSPIIETHGIANPDYDLSKATALEEENKGLYFKAQEYSEKMKIKFLFKFTYYIK
ncbi:MAG: hypothetical protein IJJ70_03570 [Treponema sp.]|nr:hypothetical protein [Treponema sp.]